MRFGNFAKTHFVHNLHKGLQSRDIHLCIICKYIMQFIMFNATGAIYIMHSLSYIVETSMKTIGFLGLGSMGQRLVKNFLADGYEVHVWSRTTERAKEVVSLGAKQHASPAEVAAQVDVIFAMVTDDEASNTVWCDVSTGALAAMRPQSVVIECSTLSVGWCNELERRINDNGSGFIAAPVVGSRPQAEARQLIFLLGGDRKIIESVETILQVNAGAMHNVGSAAQAMAMKLAVNALFGIQVAAVGELYGFLNKAGLAVEQASAVLTDLPVTSPAIKGVSALLASQQFDPLFPIELVQKDFDYAARSADGLGSVLPTTVAVRDIYREANDSGYGAQNIHAVSRLFINPPA